MFVIRLADLNIRINRQDDYLLDFFKDYIVDDNNIDFEVNISEDDIDYERHVLDDVVPIDSQCLKLAIYRKISEQLPKYNGFLFHGSALYFDKYATILAGKSGIGKSTHAKLLRQNHKAIMINDDKPLIRFINDIPYVYGTPYNGKHHLSQNISKPLKNILFINQDTNNSIVEIDSEESFKRMFAQVYRPTNPITLDLTVKLINKLNKFTNNYILNCDISVQASDISYNIIK